MKTLCAIGVIAAVLATAASTSSASLAVSVSGSTEVGPTGTLDGTINYLVLQKGPADTWSGLFGAAGATFAPGFSSSLTMDNADNYLYVFQVSNNGAFTGPITSFNNSLGQVGPADIGSWGILQGYALQYGEAEVTATNPMGANTVLVGGMIASSSVKSPFTITYLGNNTSFTQVGPGGFDASAFGGLGGYLAAGESSSILLFTADMNPLMDLGSVQGGGNSAVGASPAPVPEPATLTLLAIAGLGLVVRAARRRRLTLAA